MQCLSPFIQALNYSLILILICSIYHIKQINLDLWCTIYLSRRQQEGWNLKGITVHPVLLMLILFTSEKCCLFIVNFQCASPEAQKTIFFDGNGIHKIEKSSTYHGNRNKEYYLLRLKAQYCLIACFILLVCYTLFCKYTNLVWPVSL